MAHSSREHSAIRGMGMTGTLFAQEVGGRTVEIFVSDGTQLTKRQLTDVTLKAPDGWQLLTIESAMSAWRANQKFKDYVEGVQGGVWITRIGFSYLDECFVEIGKDGTFTEVSSGRFAELFEEERAIDVGGGELLMKLSGRWNLIRCLCAEPVGSEVALHMAFERVRDKAGSAHEEGSLLRRGEDENQ